MNHIANYKIFQEHQLNSRRFPVFSGAISNSRRFPGFRGAVDITATVKTKFEEISSIFRSDFKFQKISRISRSCRHNSDSEDSRYWPCVWVDGVLAEALVQVLGRRLWQQLVDALSFGYHLQRSHLARRPTAHHPRRVQGSEESTRTPGADRPERLSTHSNARAQCGDWSIIVSLDRLFCRY